MSVLLVFWITFFFPFRPSSRTPSVTEEVPAGTPSEERRASLISLRRPSATGRLCRCRAPTRPSPRQEVRRRSAGVSPGFPSRPSPRLFCLTQASSTWWWAPRRFCRRRVLGPSRPEPTPTPRKHLNLLSNLNKPEGFWSQELELLDEILAFPGNVPRYVHGKGMRVWIFEKTLCRSIRLLSVGNDGETEPVRESEFR